MWFLDNIVDRLDRVSGYFYDAYLEVNGWTWPFKYLSYPLYDLYDAFWYITWYFGQFNDWLDWAAGRIDAILSEWDIRSYLEWWLDRAEWSWNWVSNAAWNIWNEVDDWWSSTRYAVLSWIDAAVSEVQVLLDQANTWLATLQAAWDDFKGMIPTLDEVIYWWSNITGNILSIINTWWSGALLEVQGLINSAFVERESWWAGWQDFRDQVTEFFTDPEDWLYKAFDRIIERFW